MHNWLIDALSQTGPVPAHAPANVVPIANTAAETLAMRFENAGFMVIAAAQLWGAESNETASASLRALRRWLDDDRTRKVNLLISKEADRVGSDASGVDRRLVDGLVEYERGSQMTAHAAPSEVLASAPG